MKDQILLLFSLIILRSSIIFGVVLPEYVENSLTLTSDCHETLDLSNMELDSKINKKFFSNPKLKNIILKNNKITSLEKGIFDNIPFLEYLDLSHNKMELKNIFSFGTHKNLKTLILNYNFDLIDDGPFYYKENLYDIIPSIVYRKVDLKNTVYNFPNLKSLSLRKFNMKSISIKWNDTFPQLKYLDLSENNLNAIEDIKYNLPPSITTLILMNTNLKSLSISKNWSNLKILNFTNSNVKELNLNNNKFNIFSGNISYHSFQTDTLQLNLNNLQKLSVSGCEIKTIHVDAFVNIRNLIELNLSGNKFSEIKNGTFDHLSSLKSLDFSRNYDIKKMPDFSILKNLNNLSLNNMDNTFIFETLELSNLMTNLKYLSLRGNLLESIPEKFFNYLPSLEELDLSENKISILPAWNSQNKLKILHLNKNNVSNLYYLFLINATSLKIVNLRDNPLPYIVKNSLKNIPDDTKIFN